METIDNSLLNLKADKMESNIDNKHDNENEPSCSSPKKVKLNEEEEVRNLEEKEQIKLKIEVFEESELERNKSKNEKSSEITKCNSDDEDISMEYEIPELGFNYPLEQDASDMLDEVELDESGQFPSVTDRYFTPYYAIDVQRPGDDVCVRVHSNRICMISIAPSHTIFQENKKIVKCDYQVSQKLDRTKNKVSGKAKRGAQPLQRSSNLCALTCDDGSTCFVKCCMVGKLVEVNERLIQDPELLKREPHFGGYIAIALPNLRHQEQMKKDLLNQEQYEEAIRKRNEKKINEANVKILVKTADKSEEKEIESVEGKKIQEAKTESLLEMEYENKEKEMGDLKQLTNVENNITNEKNAQVADKNKTEQEKEKVITDIDMTVEKQSENLMEVVDS